MIPTIKNKEHNKNENTLSLKIEVYFFGHLFSMYVYQKAFIQTKWVYKSWT